MIKLIKSILSIHKEKPKDDGREFLGSVGIANAVIDLLRVNINKLPGYKDVFKDDVEAVYHNGMIGFYKIKDQKGPPNQPSEDIGITEDLKKG